ncbi:TPA: hypothetical protein DIC20_04530 [Candidatus Dependentiae bacterium]|nr:MAG: hypothetical protein US03_C0011G0006 [candidate division TM6 bacterium GW2011_GWF2_36_131]KKQ02654.1 MAG: hypothetical protein US13_C0012G0032 [candidate division TM6 bacterium GW2011_GWE2_36_25]HBR70286.1 hypothetical protein [Candidatus Dependentiae bacterium]HCU00942.1 hypothetical protein [Candidatus Dependentiae bacterium]
MKHVLFCVLLGTALSLCAEITTISSEADLKKDYPHKKISDAKLSFDLTGATLVNWTFTNIIFSEKSDANTDFSYSEFIGKDNKNTLFMGPLQLSIFNNAKFKNVIFKDQIIGAKFNKCTLENVTFEGNIDASFDAAILNNVQFKQDYKKSTFADAKISNVTNQEGKLLAISLGKLKEPEASAS